MMAQLHFGFWLDGLLYDVLIKLWFIKSNLMNYIEYKKIFQLYALYVTFCNYLYCVLKEYYQVEKQNFETL